MAGELTDADGNIFLTADDEARTDVTERGTVLCTVPITLSSGLPNEPTSSIYIPRAPHLRGIDVEAEGGLSLRFWRSMTNDPANNQVDIDAALKAGLDSNDPTFPAPDMSNHTWLLIAPIRGISFPGKRVTPVPVEVIQRGQASHWMRIEPRRATHPVVKIWATVAAG